MKQVDKQENFIFMKMGLYLLGISIMPVNYRRSNTTLLMISVQD